MKNLVRSLLFLIALAALALAAPALAGGWAVITLDELPAEAESGKPIEVGFTVLQHGKTPMTGLSPKIRVSKSATGEAFSVDATPEGEAGHYSATLIFPSEGSWDWSIEAFTMSPSMPKIEVLSGSEGTRANSFPVMPWMAAAAGLGIMAGGMLFFRRRNIPWAVTLVLIGIVVGGYGFVSAARVRAFSEANVTSPDEYRASTGRDLFIAKGCVTCHSHDEIERDGDVMVFVDFGPDLTHFTANPEYLRRWLSDPAAVKPNAAMPKLRLSDVEIDQLIAFINSK
jgi:hypothetical protein